jgi:hypothetical protein
VTALESVVAEGHAALCMMCMSRGNPAEPHFTLHLLACDTFAFQDFKMLRTVHAAL